jgi:uncharacterized tellurite resistance protein B-like protein
MNSNSKYQLGLLYLVRLLISADGVIDDRERKALMKIKEKENISDSLFQEFESTITVKKEREIYEEGIKLMNSCTDEEKLTAFVHLYKMSEADDNVHVKEVRLLLYSIRMVGIEFNDVVERAKSIK